MVQSQQSRARRYIFFAERDARHVPGASELPKRAPPRVIGVVGGGTMGCGITISLILGGFCVIVNDSKKAVLQKVSATVQSSLCRRVKRGVLSPRQRKDAESRLVLSPSLNGLSNVDMVIEAVFEDLALKKKVFEQLDAICQPRCILCTNTSALDVDAIAAVTSRPQLVRAKLRH